MHDEGSVSFNGILEETFWRGKERVDIVFIVLQQLKVITSVSPPLRDWKREQMIADCSCSTLYRTPLLLHMLEADVYNTFLINRKKCTQNSASCCTKPEFSCLRHWGANCWRGTSPHNFSSNKSLPFPNPLLYQTNLALSQLEAVMTNKGTNCLRYPRLSMLSFRHSLDTRTPPWAMEKFYRICSQN